MNNIFPVFSFNYAFAIVQAGYQPVKVEPNKHRDKTFVYWFQDLPEIRQYLPSKK